MTEDVLNPLPTWRSEFMSEEGPSARCRLVLCALSLYQSFAGDWAELPTVAELAVDSGLSEGQVRKALREARDGGWLPRCLPAGGFNDEI